MLLAILLLSLSQEPEALLREGRALLSQERFDEAERTFTRLADIDPSSPRAFYYLGLSRLRLREVPSAIEALERASALSSRPNPAVLYELGTAYLQAERFAEAARALEAATREAPGEVRFRLQLGWAYYQLVEGEKADEQLRAVLSRDPENVTAHFYRGLALAALGRLRDAAASFREAVARDSGHADARLGLARVLSQAGRDEEARSELLGVLETTPSRAPAAHNELGLIALRTGDAEEATRRFEAVLAAEPDHRQATYNLWLLYRRSGRAEADAMRERFEALSSTSSERPKLGPGHRSP